jgi:hypothetical protein
MSCCCSLLEAAYRGKPMVCVPLAADQFEGCAKAVSGGWAQLLRAADLCVASAPRLATMIEAAAADGSVYAAAAFRVSAVMRAHPRHPLDQAAGKLLWITVLFFASSIGRRTLNRDCVILHHVLAPQWCLLLLADWIEYALALPKGADLSDPAMRLPWWQRQCVDVYVGAAVVLLGLVVGAGLAARAAGRALLRVAQGSISEKKTE